VKKSDATTDNRASLLVVVAVVVLFSCLGWVVACAGDDGGTADMETTFSTDEESSESGDIAGVVSEEIKVGQAIIVVRALQSTFQPATPEQRLSEATPVAPGAGASFYQAYVRVKNTGVTPLRVDPEDFVCAVGDTVVSVEPTRSGPASRSLLKNTSLDLLLTFKGAAGFQPMLIYSPPWYDGIISISPGAEETTSTTT
jgi:hypothetical protein